MTSDDQKVDQVLESHKSGDYALRSLVIAGSWVGSDISMFVCAQPAASRITGNCRAAVGLRRPLVRDEDASALSCP
jgi:hypothetical protein